MRGRVKGTKEAQEATSCLLPCCSPTSSTLLLWIPASSPSLSCRCCLSVAVVIHGPGDDVAGVQKPTSLNEGRAGVRRGLQNSV